MQSWLEAADDQQQAALEFAVQRNAAGLLLPPGYGKTAISLADIQCSGAPALVICPLRPLYASWPKEARKWREFADMRVTILHGPKKEERLKAGADVYLVNPENFEWVLAQNRLSFKSLYVDESSKFKNPQSQRFKLLRANLERFDVRRILTGSFMPNSIADVFSQTYILDGGERLGRYITHFRNMYMVDVAPRQAPYPNWVAAPGAYERVMEKISDICITMPDDRAPPVEFNRIEVELPGTVRKQYKQMEDQFFAELSAGVVTASNAGAKTMKLRQIASGFVYDGEAAEWMHQAKVDALLDLVGELGGEPLLVAVQFRAEAEHLQAALRKVGISRVPYLGQGGLPASQMTEMIRDWNAGKLPVVFAHPASAGHGIDEMQHGGRTVCWFSQTYNYEEFDQLNRRLRRRGQERLTRIHQIVASDTVDDVMIEITGAKGKRQVNFLDALRQRRS